MTSSISHLAALGIIAAVVGGVALAAKTGTGVDQPGISSQGAYTFKAAPPGTNGPLRACIACHSIEEGGPLRVAPNLYGIVGAPKARAKWYAYSAALRQAGGVWSEKDLDSYLTKPSAFLPGSAKTIVGIADPAERAKVIAALKGG